MKVSISDPFTRTELFVLYELITNLEFLPVFPSFFFFINCVSFFYYKLLFIISWFIIYSVV
jgi:hypothetical protein